MKIATHWGGVIIKLGIGCVVCLLLGAAVLLYAQDEKKGYAQDEKKAAFIGTKPKMDAEEMKEMAAAKRQTMNKAPERSQPQRNSAWGRQNRGGVDFGENEAFYKTIIEYNLFRPLGWTPPNNEPSYSLIGTAVNSNGIISQATLLERRSNRYHFVTVGTKLDDMTVKEIQGKKVIMDKEGETVTLNTGSLQLLKTERGNESNRGGGGGEGGSESARNSEGQSRASQMAAEKRRQAEQKKREYSREQMRREAMEKLRNASSPEERREIIQWMRKEFGETPFRRDRDR